MTKEDALDQCEILWSHLAETGSDDKYWAVFEILDTSLQFACPACDWVIETFGHHDCTQCPVWEWRQTARNGNPNAPCIDDGPYCEWSEATDSEARASAARGVLQLVRGSRGREDGE